MRLPALTGQPIEVRYQTGLSDTAGNPAHAATFIRRRLIVLDEELTRNKTEHRRILIHEIFHFGWVRLGNQARREWEDLLRAEIHSRARGETGWSAEWRKNELRATDMAGRTMRWREYCCESFCDTAAANYGNGKTEVTLGKRHLVRRGQWFLRRFESERLAI